MRLRRLAVPLLAFALAATAAHAGDLVRFVRSKLSAGDLASAESLVEVYEREKGADAEALDATGWLARGAFMLGDREKAAGYVARLRAAIPEEKEGLTIPYGAAIEVEAKLRAAKDGRGAALAYLAAELPKAKDVALRARIEKNIDLLSLEGTPAPEIAGSDPRGLPVPTIADLRGKVVLLFLWAHWCGDCREMGPVVARVAESYRDRGLAVIAPTRLYGTGDENRDATPDEERAHISKVLTDFYPGLSAVPTPIDTETMIRYGVSATPTLVLIDREGIVRLYTPTRMTETELRRRVEELLAEGL